MRVLLLCLSCLLASVIGLYEDLFKIDVEAVLKDEKKLTEIYDCLMDHGPCEKYQLMKETIPKLIVNNCSDCTTQQKAIYDKTVEKLMDIYAISAVELSDQIIHPSNLTKNQQMLFRMNVLNILTDENEVKAIIDCLMDRAPCDKYRYFKETIPKIVRNKCEGCSKKENELFGKTYLQFSEKYPALYKEFNEKMSSPLTDEEDFFENQITNLSDLKLAKELIDCLLERPGPCEKFKKFLHLVPDLMKTKCGKCAPDNKQKYDYFEKIFKEKFAMDYMELVKKNT